MDEWVQMQENPVHRFQQSKPWSNDSIDQRNIEERIIQSSIQTLLQKMISHSDNSSSSPVTLQKLLTRYAQLKMMSYKYDAMNMQRNQMNVIIQSIEMKEDYVKHMKNQRKLLNHFSKSKYLKPKEIDLLESKLKNDIDTIEPGNIVEKFDTVISPLTRELELETNTLRDCLYDDKEGIVKNQMREVLLSCMPPLSNEETKIAIVNECLEACYNNK